MRNLRRLIRRAGLLSRAEKRGGSSRSYANTSVKRRLGNETLEKRELLAGDLGSASNHNYWNPYDVNADHQITARDALGVINYLGQNGEGEEIAGDTPMFLDVNADGRISASDALGVINALGRGEEVGEYVELLLTARTTADVLITPDTNGDVNVNVGEAFDLEIAYDDLRVNQFLQPAVELGVFQLFTDIAVSQPNVLMPILNETQRLIIDSSVITEFGNNNIDSFDFSIPEAPPGVTGGQLTYTASAADFGANPVAAVTSALEAFGYTTGQFEISTLDFGTGGDIGYQVHWTGDEFGNVDLPNVSIDVIEVNPATEVPTETIEYAPFLADGETPNPDAVRFNLNTYSRTFNPTALNPSGEKFYASQNRGTFDPATGFDEVGGLGLVPLDGGGVPDLTDDGSFDQPFDAFSLRVYLKSAVTDFVVSVNPGEDAEAMLLYGRDEAVPQDFVLVESIDTNGNGVNQVVLN
ncbi:MAG: dockerin type I domain-containing protein, partial [Rubripirellula sp.]|nr:dockerin type I domain-containing protein [Rubripirellula sp.]